ncbi:MAG: hypothetical protein ABSF45_29655 [Terriglobia bacterium]
MDCSAGVLTRVFEVTRKVNRGCGYARHNQYDDADRLVAVTNAAQNSTVYGGLAQGRHPLPSEREA